MDSMIYDPLKEYDETFRARHAEQTKQYLDALVRRAGLDIEQNRRTVADYHRLGTDLGKLRKRFLAWRILRVVMILTVILIPLVIFKVTPRIRVMRANVADTDRRVNELYELAEQQTAPLNSLFSDRDALKLIEQTIPLLSFAPNFSIEQETDMRRHFDRVSDASGECSAFDLLAGHYNGNPFLFQSRLFHYMGSEVYHGYKTIHWTETYCDSKGETHTRTCSETLHASVVKPKPFFDTEVFLDYGAQSGDDLSFSRDATHLEQKSERSIERYIKRGEKRIKKKTDRALRKNGDFTGMSNSDFDVLFDALDRTNEVQFRALFTPLAQTNMVSLIRSRIGYGDDFHFIKQNRMNRIISEHSQGRSLTIAPAAYRSYSYDIIEECFLGENENFFRAVYFDLAPLLAIPSYQERPSRSLQSVSDRPQAYTREEYEVLSNRVRREYTVHPRTKTEAILKPTFVKTKNGIDEIDLTAYSYDILPRVDFIPVHGGDGYWHDVPVPWEEYIPLKKTDRFCVASVERAGDQPILAERDGLCIFK